MKLTIYSDDRDTLLKVAKICDTIPEITGTILFSATKMVGDAE